MPDEERVYWLERLPRREVVVEREVPVPVPVTVPAAVVRVKRTVGVIVDRDGAPRRRHSTDADVVRCPLCGAWTLGVCRTGHGAP